MYVSVTSFISSSAYCILLHLVFETFIFAIILECEKYFYFIVFSYFDYVSLLFQLTCFVSLLLSDSFSPEVVPSRVMFAAKLSEEECLGQREMVICFLMIELYSDF